MSELAHPTPRVIACTPAWNAEAFIERTLLSLASQTYPNLRVLISDDASTDSTAAICAAFAARDARFSLVRQPRRLGWIGNSNALLDGAARSADHLLFAFHDDVLKPDYVARLVARLEQNPRAILAHSDVLAFYLDGSCQRRVYAELSGVTSPVERARLILRQAGHWSVPHRGVFRARAARANGGMRRHLAGEVSADWPWLLHMALLGEFERVPEFLCEKHYQQRSLSRGWNFNLWSRTGAMLSCAREVRKAELPFADKLGLYALMARRVLGWLRRARTSRVRVRT